MRHEDIDLTKGVSTDKGLFDLSAAVETLPLMPLVMPWDGVHRGSPKSTDVHSGGAEQSDQLAS